MAVDIRKLFDQDLPAAMAANPDRARAVGAKYQFNVPGEGAWFIDASSTGPSCASGTHPADCTLTLSAEDFQKLVENPQANGTQFIYAGKIKVSGNPQLAIKFSQLLTLA